MLAVVAATDVLFSCVNSYRYMHMSFTVDSACKKYKYNEIYTVSNGRTTCATASTSIPANDAATFATDVHNFKLVLFPILWLCTTTTAPSPSM